MKSSKAKVRGPVQETCGVWLDTMELKQKAKKKQLAPPIYKLLNPSAKSGGYGLAVALNFTQTKMEMPKTKQSNISAFFTAHRRVLHKMGASEDPNLASVGPSSSPAAVTPPSSGRKRRRERSDSFPAELDSLAHEWESEDTIERRARDSPSSDMRCERVGAGSEPRQQPQDKESLADSQWPAHTWSQDPLLTWSQRTEAQSDAPDHRSQNFNSLQSEEVFRNLVGVAGRTSTQKSLNHRPFSGSDDDKENGFLLESPGKRSAFAANHDRRASPRKRVHPLWEKPEKEEKLKWTKPKSPLRKGASRPQSAAEEESWASLFTQDSQGSRVIAHRRLDAPSPLREQRNVKTHQSVAEDDDEDDMLFTQDSQGNLVIKHE